MTDTATYTATGTHTADFATEAPEAMQASTAAALVRSAGRPWALRLEAMEVLVSVLADGGPAAGQDFVGAEIKPMRVEGQVAVIPLHGVITPDGTGPLAALLGEQAGLFDFRENLREAAENDDVKRIVLDIGSPGGLVDQVPETAALIREVREDTPVTALANTVATSAAYWLGAQANEFLVSPSGEVGSIGVYMMHADTSGAHERAGVDITLTSAGKYKTEGNQFEPLSPSARRARQEKVDNMYAMFVRDVAEGRGVAEAAVRGGYGEGRALLAEEAVSHGLADRKGTLEDVIGEAIGVGRTTAKQEAIRRFAMDLL